MLVSLCLSDLVGYYTTTDILKEQLRLRFCRQELSIETERWNKERFQYRILSFRAPNESERTPWNNCCGHATISIQFYVKLLRNAIWFAFFAHVHEFVEARREVVCSANQTHRTPSRSRRATFRAAISFSACNQCNCSHYTRNSVFSQRDPTLADATKTVWRLDIHLKRTGDCNH